MAVLRTWQSIGLLIELKITKLNEKAHNICKTIKVWEAPWRLAQPYAESSRNAVVNLETLQWHVVSCGESRRVLAAETGIVPTAHSTVQNWKGLVVMTLHASQCILQNVLLLCRMYMSLIPRVVPKRNVVCVITDDMTHYAVTKHWASRV